MTSKERIEKINQQISVAENKLSMHQKRCSAINSQIKILKDKRNKLVTADIIAAMDKGNKDISEIISIIEKS